ncbi:MAG: branched-chain amino acid aminotransferase [Clostridia bacterium]
MVPSFIRSTSLKSKPSFADLGFGKVFTDHMFVMDYSRQKGWFDPRIVPYAPLSMDPSTTVLHYGQGVFEGMKAYLSKTGKILLFRPEKNMERLNRSCERMCIPPLDGTLVLDALKELLRIEKGWIPDQPGTSLYIRPFVIATDAFLGVRPSSTYTFMIILSPVGSYYPTGINPVRIYVEEEYVRSVPGATGEVKTMGNYAASLKAHENADKNGCVQVLWLDALEHRYIEEVGSMNVFFNLDGQVITPALSGSILPGITRMSVLELLRSWDVPAYERKISIDEIIGACSDKTLRECFGAGTAAVISPVGELVYKGNSFLVNNGMTGDISKRVYEQLTNIQYGMEKDPFGWTVEV